MDAILLAFIAYLILVLIIGLVTVRVTRNLDDFALGGQRLGPWVIAFSERASGESAWLLIGLPGAALVSGLLELWTVIGCVTGIIVSWIIIAKPLRLATGEYQALTVPELLARKTGDESGVIRFLSSIIIIWFFTFYVAAQFSGAGKVLNVTFGLKEMEGMIIGAVIIVLYTMLGGFLAVAWTDLIQGIIMIGTLVILPLVAAIEYAQLHPAQSLLDWGTLFGGKTGLGAFSGAVAGLSWGLGYMGQPHLVTRFMAISDPDQIKIGRRIATAWAIPAFFGAMWIGIIGGAMLQQGVLPVPAGELTDPEKLMPLMATTLLPAGIAGILISGAIAAMMSTADSQLLVSTTVVTEDLLGNWARKRSINLLALGRLFTLIVGVVGFILAWRSTELVFSMVSYAWSGLGASFGPVLIAILWWKGVTRKGVIAGLVTGSVTTILWANMSDLRALMTERLVSFVLAFLALVVVSLWENRQHADS
ncbi:MAG: sodium/proline symporter [Candidatus Neomarinimicrobiota bacterium]|nr:MAG: sodium/proline symporter [Candidatus Neomarinimicrobiota bacterium]